MLNVTSSNIVDEPSQAENLHSQYLLHHPMHAMRTYNNSEQLKKLVVFLTIRKCTCQRPLILINSQMNQCRNDQQSKLQTDRWKDER